MHDLLADILAAHGGIDRWRSFDTLTAHLVAGGPFWGLKGWPDLLTNLTLTLDTRRQHITISPFLMPAQTSFFDVAPERFTIKAADGTLIEFRDDPRASFAAELDTAQTTPWDEVHTGYFISYGLWN